MRFSLGLAVPSVVATLSTVLLCSDHGNVATHAELFAARRLGRSAEGKTNCRADAGANDRESHRASGSSTAQEPVFGPNTVLGKISRLEKSASSCNGGCETSYRVGNAPWVGCSFSGSEPFTSHFSATCRDTLTYNTYAQCVETKALLGSTSRESRWICTSLLAGGELAGEKQVAKIRAAASPRRPPAVPNSPDRMA